MKTNYSNLFKNFSDFGSNIGRLLFETLCITRELQDKNTLTLVSIYDNCDKRKLRFIKDQDVSQLFIKLEIKSALSNVSLNSDILC